MIQKEKIVGLLNLKPHPEGGFYRETYRSNGEIAKSALPVEFNASRNFATGIYFLITAEAFSAFHKVNQDEM